VQDSLIASIQQVGDFPTDGRAMTMLVIPASKAVPSRKLGRLDGLLRGLGKSKPASRIASVGGNDEVSGFEHLHNN